MTLSIPSAIPSRTRSYSPGTSDEEADFGSDSASSRSQSPYYDTPQEGGAASGSQSMVLSGFSVRKYAELQLSTSYNLWIKDLFYSRNHWDEIPLSLSDHSFTAPLRWSDGRSAQLGKLILGAMPLKSRWTSWNERDVLINKLEVKAVLCMTEHFENHSVGLLTASVTKDDWESQNIAFLQVETEDHKSISMGAFAQAVGFINAHITSGHNVLVHCKAGMSRSAAVVLCYLRYHHWATFQTLDEGWAHIKKHRPMVWLEECKKRDVATFCRDTWAADVSGS